MDTNRNPRTIGIVIVVIALIAAAYWYFAMGPGSTAAASGALTASGTVETTEISIAPEVSGKLLTVDVEEGAKVTKGQKLFTMDSTLLDAQKNVALATLEGAKGSAATAAAAVAAAQVQYDIAYNAALAQDKVQTRTSDWVTNPPQDFTVPNWYFTQSEQITAAQAEEQTAEASLADFQAKLARVQSQVSSEDFVKAEADLAQAQARFAVANNLNNRVQKQGVNIDDASRHQLYMMALDARLVARGRDPKWISVNNIDSDLRDAAQKIYDDAKSNLKDAQSAYDDALSTQGAQDVMNARADVSMAQELVYTSQDYVRSLQVGVEANSVTAVSRALDQAKAAARQADIAVSQAQANLDLLNAQMSKLTVYAPSDGVILTRAAEPGSVVNAGGVILTLGDLSHLTITVYVPEDRLGDVDRAKTAKVKVDSFPGETFDATVSTIADQAEFTPRNVQTVEGRKDTVFAVKLTLVDPKGELKPGMPADVTFGK